MIYLDSAATSLIKPATVEQAVITAMRTMASPGRGAYVPAMKAAETLYDCRLAAAKLFNVKEPENIVFTMNATHALNIAIKSFSKEGKKALISGFEHNSVLRPLVASGAEIHVFGRKLFDTDAVLFDFEKKIKSADFAVCTHVSNVFGFILPIYEIAELCRSYNKPLIVDASQSAGTLNVDFERLAAAFVAMPGHKGLFGPQGTGLLLCGVDGSTLIQGGSGTDSRSLYMPKYLPDSHEAGTHNVSGIAGLLAGIRYVSEKGVDNIFSHEKKMLDIISEVLENKGYDIFVSPERKLQSGVLSLRHKKIDCECIAASLYNAGICVRSGLHCAPLAHESAGTLESGTVRLSTSPFVSKTQMEYVCNVLASLEI